MEGQVTDLTKLLNTKTYALFAKRFSTHEEDDLLQQALIYLKLREKDCSTQQALRFSKRHEKASASIVMKNGTPSYNIINQIRSSSVLSQCWLSGNNTNQVATLGYPQSIEFTKGKERELIQNCNRLEPQSDQKDRSQQRANFVYTKKKQLINQTNIIRKNVLEEWSQSQKQFNQLGIEFPKANEIPTEESQTQKVVKDTLMVQPAQPVVSRTNGKWKGQQQAKQFHVAQKFFEKGQFIDDSYPAQQIRKNIKIGYQCCSLISHKQLSKQKCN